MFKEHDRALLTEKRRGFGEGGREEKGDVSSGVVKFVHIQTYGAH